MIDGNLPMFKDFKKKTEELKKLAEEKAKNINASGIKTALEKSKTELMESSQKTLEISNRASSQAKTIVSKSFDKAYHAASEAGNKSMNIVESSAKKTSVLLSDTATHAKSAIISGQESASEIVERYGPAMEKIVVNGLIDIAEDKLSDEDFLNSTLEKIYEFLPTSIRIVVGRELFISFFIKSKTPILKKIKEHKEKNADEYHKK